MRARTIAGPAHPERLLRGGGLPCGLWHVLMALGMLTVAACGAPPAPSRSAPVPPATATFVPADVVGSVTSLHMFDATIGWAASVDRLLRTTDGGLHWADVTPAPPPGSSRPHIDAFALSPTDTWVVRRLTDAGPGASTSAVSHTSDGGQTWHSITLPVFAVAQITFVDTMHGWMLADLDTADGEQAADIFRTADGGQTWAKVASTDDRAGALPVQGRKSGLTFRDATTGWATGAGLVGANVGRPPWFFRTHNGGVTWQPVPLALPTTLARYSWFYVAGTQPPTFFSAQVGALAVAVGSQAAGGAVLSVVYVTRDGGSTWSPTTPVQTAPDVTSVLDSSHWWIAADTDSGASLFRTTDGGAHWETLAPSGPFAHVSVLSFVSTTQGWAIGSAGLLRTTDGGRTWTVLAAAPPGA